MSASRTKKERQAAATRGLTEKQKREIAETKKKKRNRIIYIVIAVVIVIAVAALLIWDSGVIQKRTTALEVGDKSYGVVDLDYYYYSTYAGYYSYASYYGLDTEAPLDEQEISEGYTWDDMLRESAVATLTSVSILSSEAEAAGYELSEDGQAYVDSAVETAALYASLYGYSEDYYLQANFGQYMTASNYRRILTEYELASEYADFKEESFDVTDAEIEDYYEENAVSLDTILYDCYYVSITRTGTDENGDSYDLDDDELEANRAEAEAEAREILDAMNAEDADTVSALAEEYGATDYSDYANPEYYNFGDWLSDTSHQAGDGDVWEYVNSSDVTMGYYAIRINERYLDPYCAANARILTIYADEIENDDEDADVEYDMDACITSAKNIMASFEDTDMTSEDFATVYEDNGGSSSYEGGLIEDITKSDYNDEMTEWLFSDERSQGDYQLFTDEDNACCYLIYFENYADIPYWRSVTIAQLKSDKFDAWADEVSENYESDTGFGYRFMA